MSLDIASDSPISSQCRRLLKEQMAMQNVSQSRLSRLSGVSQATIRGMLDGSSSPSLRTVDKLFDAIKVEVRVEAD